MINKFVKVKYLFTLNMGQSPDSESCNTLGNGIPFLQGKADFGHISPTPKTYCISPKKIADTGDVLLSVRASCSAAAMDTMPGMFSVPARLPRS